MYAFYFQKNQTTVGPEALGHKHDWEHVVVWVQGDTPVWVAVSQHDKYFWRHRDQIQWHDGTHAKIVYHKDGAGKHEFRHATSGDEPPENHKGTSQLPMLVGWDHFPDDFREKLVSANFEDAKLALKNGAFEEDLKNAKPSEVSFNPRG